MSAARCKMVFIINYLSVCTCIHSKKMAYSFCRIFSSSCDNCNASSSLKKMVFKNIG